MVEFKGSSSLLQQQYDVCHDKGTYDAINLCPEEPLVKREKYIINVHKLTKDDGLFILTSVNWTEEELKSQFENCKSQLFLIFISFEIILPWM